MIKERILLTVIMPALNEEKNVAIAIGNTLKAFETFNINGEIIVINDGSEDGTEKVVNKIICDYANKDIIMIKHDHPMGIGASFWEGVDNARGEAVVLMPGDNENDPWEILRYFNLLDHVDLVIPFIYNREVRPAFRNILSLSYRLIINSTFKVNFNYTNGTVIYRKSVLKELKYRSHGFFFQTDILVRSVKQGYLFAEVPYWIGKRKEGVSKALSFPSLVCVAKGYFRLISDFYFKKSSKINLLYTKDSLTARRWADRNTANHL